MDAPTPEPVTRGWGDIIPHWRLALLDLRRLYGIDLTDPATLRGPWSRIRPYLLGLLLDSSSLLYRAVWR